MYSCIQECVVWLVKWLALFSQSLTLCLLTHNTQCTTYLHYPGCPPRVWHVTAAWISRACTPFVVCELPDFSWVKERYSSFLSLVVLLPTKEKKRRIKKKGRKKARSDKFKGIPRGHCKPKHTTFTLWAVQQTKQQNAMYSHSTHADVPLTRHEILP